ncbi:hypothetical protein PENSPDRAFT_159684 [Peniophora sp. CONT]|nr:hypothetical protein PENSPDRAFT_159684 [Peniophora sp. CONT]
MRPGFESWREQWQRSQVPPGHHHMDYNPWGWHAHRYRRFGFGRRLFWFGFGAFAALACARHHGMVQMGHEGERGRGEWDGGWNGGCRRVEYQPRLVPEGERQDDPWRHWRRSWHHRHRDEQPAQPQPETPVSAPAPAPPVMQSVPVQAATGYHTPAPHPPPAGSTIPVVEQQWEADMRAFTRQASDRVCPSSTLLSSIPRSDRILQVTEMSEATIDSLVSGLQGLKTRMAEHRAEAQKQLEAEEERKRHHAQAGQALALPVQQSTSGKQPPRLV